MRAGAEHGFEQQIVQTRQRVRRPRGRGAIPWPRCLAQPGSPYRSRSGAVAGVYHTGRFKKVPRLAKQLRVPTPADRGPGQSWRPGTPPPAAPDTETPGADIRIGYARCSHLTQELQSQLDALAAHGIADLHNAG